MKPKRTKNWMPNAIIIRNVPSWQLSVESVICFVLFMIFSLLSYPPMLALRLSAHILWFYRSYRFVRFTRKMNFYSKLANIRYFTPDTYLNMVFNFHLNLFLYLKKKKRKSNILHYILIWLFQLIKFRFFFLLCICINSQLYGGHWTDTKNEFWCSV